MSEAKLYNGVALVAYVNGVGVDSEGNPVKGAPKQPEDTDPSLQPHAQGSLNSEERSAAILANALASALAGRLPAPVVAGGEDEEDVDEPGALTLDELPAHLATLTTVEEVKEFRKGDKRKGAKALYEARIAELEGE